MNSISKKIEKDNIENSCSRDSNLSFGGNLCAAPESPKSTIYKKWENSNFNESDLKDGSLSRNEIINENSLLVLRRCQRDRLPIKKTQYCELI